MTGLVVLCHGDFLNADHDYEHENKSVKGFGCYGDIMIRDRKMYVLPTPYRLATGAAHHRTLILPARIDPGKGFVRVGALQRREADDFVVSYSFDLRTNEMAVVKVPNPDAGRVHEFSAWRLEGDPTDPVSMALGDVEAAADVGDDEE
jgi:hypothetical protein